MANAVAMVRVVGRLQCSLSLRSYLLVLNADSPVLAAKLAFTPP